MMPGLESAPKPGPEPGTVELSDEISEGSI